MLPIEILGSAFNLLHLCLLHSLYSFEYKWFSQVHQFMGYEGRGLGKFSDYSAVFRRNLKGVEYFSKCIFPRALPKCAIPQAETSPNRQTKLSEAPQAATRTDLRSWCFGNCTFGKLQLGKVPLGSCHFGKILRESTLHNFK